MDAARLGTARACRAGPPKARARRGEPGPGAAAAPLDELRVLMETCKGRFRDLVPVLALAGLRWGELAGLQVGDRVRLPGPGLRLRRAVLASGGGGSLYVDTLKNNRARTMPLVLDLVPIVDRWSAGKASNAWLFEAPGGGPLRESNWKRSVGWSGATAALGLAASESMICGTPRRCGWKGADPKVVQRVLGHATAAMTMDLYGHPVDANLRQAARLVGRTTGAPELPEDGIRTDSEPESGAENG